jgi:hypothetical protein
MNCSHVNLKFQYNNAAQNSVHHCTDCKRLIIKKPNDEQLYMLDENIQLVPINH